MARTFHQWTRAGRIEPALGKPLYHAPTGFSYTIVDSGGALYQTEFLARPDGSRMHELTRRMDYVMGSGAVARTYFTQENGRLFQLPLTWYRSHGWDFSPGYEVNNARFDRLMPDRCISCHSSYPEPKPFLEGKYAELRPGIGCERCHGPGALHVEQRRVIGLKDVAYDATIVNPAHLPLERRLDVCEQCHVHTAVTVLREGKDNFSYVPSQPLRDQAAFFKQAGSIDIVSHADRLRQSRCFIATRASAKPLECATCHDPHQPVVAQRDRNQSCKTCHAGIDQKLASSSARADHQPTSDCVRCHMPSVQERAVHGAFTDHWIRVVDAAAARPKLTQAKGSPIEPFYDRDKRGPEAPIYQRMGEIVYATLASDGRVMRDAATTLDRALGDDTTRGEARFLVGAAYQQLGMTAEAARTIERAVRIDSNPDRLRALANVYARLGRDPADVERLYEQALAEQPALAWIRAEYADYLRSLGRRADAEREYRAALAEQPNLAVARFNLGTLLVEQGRLEESSRALGEAVHLDPLLAQALTALFQLRTDGNAVTSVSLLGSPLRSVLVRERNPRAFQVNASSDASRPGFMLVNVPPSGVVQILRPDGTLMRAMRTGDGWMLPWDGRDDAGRPIGGGVYRARVQVRDAAGRSSASQQLYFAVVRTP
jgi:Tfp pilus assembly protein PilF